MRDPVWRPVVDALRALYNTAGRPSYRDIGQRAGLSHTTVHNALTGNGPAGMTWRTVTRLSAALDGDPAELKPLFDAAVEARPPTRRVHWHVWRQDVVSAAWATISALRTGDKAAVGVGLTTLDELFETRPPGTERTPATTG